MSENKPNDQLDKGNEKFVYLTESSYKQLINNTDIKSFNFEDAMAIFKQYYDNWRFYKMFNKNDIKFLYKNFSLLSGEENNIYYRQVEERKDDLGYIIELKGKLKYHLNPNCEGLNRGFRNFIMPAPITRIEDEFRKTELVTEIRNWFKSNNYTIERYLNNEINDKLLTETFNKFFPLKYNIEQIIISQSCTQFKWYTEKKSDSVKIDKEFDMKDFQNNVNDIIRERNNLCKHSNQLWNLSKYDFLHSKPITEIKSSLIDSISNNYLKDVNLTYLENMGWENIITFWKAHLIIKYKARNEFMNLLKWKFNHRQNALLNIKLEDYNFECCIKCLDTSLTLIFNQG
ncbi:hypothetical protein VB796_12745 [Arcicella sp. LKC2W]|uniref:hypothetical protein n=1 Tax=Arcicella sp. LKC2W TaxID=2984198 RepID=UPI002B20AB51|nr:hypothetical protein [Arcicella sp. LKC2W]MEA5459915.1 hypothetical protein [Arcicella sp. LKC2W]